MISHDEALEQMSAYFASQLSRDQVKAFHAHINGCDDCKVRIRTMKSAAPRPGFTRGNVEQQDKMNEILRRNRVIMLAVIAVLVCFFLMFSIKRGL